MGGQPGPLLTTRECESISNTRNWLDRNGALDYPNASYVNGEADDQSNNEPDNGIEVLANPEHQDVCGAPKVPGIILPTQRPIRQVDKCLMTVTAMESSRNTGHQTK